MKRKTRELIKEAVARAMDVKAPGERLQLAVHHIVAAAAARSDKDADACVALAIAHLVKYLEFDR